MTEHEYIRYMAISDALEIRDAAHRPNVKYGEIVNKSIVAKHEHQARLEKLGKQY